MLRPLLIGTIAFIALATSCKKDNTQVVDCFSDAATVRQVSHKQATVMDAGGRFYIVEQGAIDNKLNPCNLPQEFQVSNLQVTVSGKVKSTRVNGPEPCCMENFVITSISR